MHHQRPIKDISKKVTYAYVHVTSVSIRCVKIVIIMPSNNTRLLLTVVQKMAIIEMLQNNISYNVMCLR